MQFRPQATLFALLSALAAQPITSETAAQSLTLERPVLDWSHWQRPDGTWAYWSPDALAKHDATLASVCYRPLDEKGKRITAVGMMPPKVLAGVLANARPELERSHELGIKIIGYCDAVMFTREILEAEGIVFEDVAAYRTDGTPAGNTYYDPRGVNCGCIRKPRWLELQKTVTRMTAEAGFDGLMFDAYPLAFAPHNQCHCSVCEKDWKAYSAATLGDATPMPGNDQGALDLSRVPDQAYMKWRLQSYVDFVKAIEADVHTKHPDFRIVMNHNADTLDFGYQAIHGAFQYPSTEINHMKVGESSSMYMFRFCEALMDEPCLVVINAASQIEPATRYRILMAEALAGGGAVYAAGYGEASDITRRFHAFMKEHEGWLAGFKSAARTAVLYSWEDHAFAQTGKFGPGFSLGQGRNYYRKAGAFLERHQIPYDCLVVDRGLSSKALAAYDNIVVPNMQRISDVDRAALMKYASSGGSLVILGSLTGCNGDDPGIQRLHMSTLESASSDPPLPAAIQACSIQVAPARNLVTTIRRNGNRLALHLIRRGEITPDTNLTLRLRYPLPEGTGVAKAAALSPQPEPLGFDWDVDSGELLAELKGMERYALVALELK